MPEPHGHGLIGNDDLATLVRAATFWREYVHRSDHGIDVAADIGRLSAALERARAALAAEQPQTPTAEARWPPCDACGAERDEPCRSDDATQPCPASRTDPPTEDEHWSGLPPELLNARVVFSPPGRVTVDLADLAIAIGATVTSPWARSAALARLDAALNTQENTGHA